MFRFAALLTCAAVLGIDSGIVPGAAAELPLEHRVSPLILQLDHPDFRQRIAAEQGLRSVGTAVIPYLETALTTGSGELQYRASRLLGVLRAEHRQEQMSLLITNPWRVGGDVTVVWEKFHALAGDSTAARALFIYMMRRDPELTLSLAGDPKVTRLLLEERCVELQNLQQFSNTVAVHNGTTIALLFATLCMENTGPRTASMVNSLLQSESFHTVMQSEERLVALRQPSESEHRTASAESNSEAPSEPTRLSGFDATGPLRSLLAHWVMRRGLISAHARINFAVRYKLPEGVGAARELLFEGQSQIAQPQMAIFFLAEYAGPEAVPQLESLLNDASQLRGSRAGSEIKFASQVCDVALLALLKRTSQDPVTYGFTALRPDGRFGFEPDTIGFASETDRQAALTKWETWRNQHLPRELKPWNDASEGALL